MMLEGGKVSTTPGEIIRAARIRARVSQAELAKRVGTNQSAVSFIERGQRIPDVETAVRIADALGTPRSEFLNAIAESVAHA